MRLGALHGITAPWLIVLDRHGEDISKLLWYVRGEADIHVVSEAYRELCAFSAQLNALPVKFEFNIGALEDTQNLVIPAFASDEALINPTRYMADYALRKMLQPDSVFDIKYRSVASVLDACKDWLYANGIDDNGIVVARNKLYRDVFAKSESTPGEIYTVREMLKAELRCREVLDERKVSLSADAVDIVNVMLTFKNDILRLVDLFSENALHVSGTTIFGLPEHSFLNRKPASVLWQVQNVFNTIGAINNREQIFNSANYIRQEIQKLSELLDTRVSVESTTTTVSTRRLAETKVSTEVSAFAEEFELNLRFEDQVELVSAILPIVEKCNVDLLNEVFSTQLSRRQWEAVFRELDTIYLGGFSFAARTLFAESFKQLALSADERVRKSADFVSEMREYIENCEYLVDSLITPIGTPLKEV